MPKPLGQFFITDAFTTTLGWKLRPGQTSVNAVVYVNNQSPQEFDIWGNGTDYLGKAPAWISFWKFTMPLVYGYVEFRPTMSLNPLGPPALYVNGIVFESYESDPEWQPIAVVRQVDTARQIRSVAVPMGLSHFMTGFWQAGDPDPIVLGTATISASNGNTMPIYLYYANIVPATSVPNIAMTFQLQHQWRDNANNPVGGPFTYAQGNVGNTSVSDFVPWVFAPVWPFAAVGGFPGGAVKADLQIKQLGGTKMNLIYTVGFWADQFNPIGDSDIGTQAIYNANNPNLNPYF